MINIIQKFILETFEKHCSNKTSINNNDNNKEVFVIKGIEFVTMSDDITQHKLFGFESLAKTVKSQEILNVFSNQNQNENIFYLTYKEFLLINKLGLIGLFDAYGFNVNLIDYNFFDKYYTCEINESSQKAEMKINQDKDDELQEYFLSFENVGKWYSYVYNTQLQYDFNKVYKFNTISNSNIQYQIKYYDNEEFVLSSSSIHEIVNYTANTILNDETYYFLEDPKKNPIYFKHVLNSISISNINCVQIKKVEKYKTSNENDYISILQRKSPKYFFRTLKIYKNPELIDSTLVDISQEVIINEIYSNAIKAKNNKTFHDTFVTAPTGSGKSIMFQIPAIKLAEEYSLVTLVISPLIGLMKDQVNNIQDMTDCAATINSDFTPEEKEIIKKQLDNGEKSILYISPETLLSNGDIKTLIGNREIGLMVIDEAHTVATWGKSFRPDYWYLGDFLKSLKKYNKEIHFPTVAFTATAVYGGLYDMYYDIVDSLDLNVSRPFIGKVIREDIEFDINLQKKTLDYREEKDTVVYNAINNFINKNEKTLVYFPYVRQLKKIYSNLGIKQRASVSRFFGGLTRIEKDEALTDFRDSKTTMMLATKAFGMGIDIDDIKNVYHFAPTGNLSDYVQEIGRAARRTDIIGKASTDYFVEDFRYIKQLYGLSSVKKYEITGVLKKIIEIYNSQKKRNLLVSPEEFAHVFSETKDEDIDNRLKTVLLIIKKDLENNRNTNVYDLIFKPRGMYTEGLYLISDSDFPFFEKHGWNKYLTVFKTKKQMSHEDRGDSVSYNGNVYLLKFKDLWQDLYRDMTFGQFKKAIFDGKIGDFYIGDMLKSKVWLKIESSNDLNFGANINRLKEFLNVFCSTLDYFRAKKEHFQISTFADKLYSSNKTLFNSITHCQLVSSTVLYLLNELEVNYTVTGSPYFMQFNSTTNKYSIKSTKYIIKRDEIFRASHRYFKNYLKLKNQMFIQSNSAKNDKMRSNKLIVIAQIFELLGLANYTIKSGDRPEFFIRVNTVSSLESMISEYYQSPTINKLREIHDSSINIMDYFFTNISTNEERWRLIENYFLGMDITELLGKK